MPASNPPSLYARINAIRAQAGSFPKNGYNQHHGFAFVQSDDILNGLRDLYVKHGVCVAYMGVTKYERTEAGTTRSGNQKFRFTVHIRCRVVNVDNPEEFFEVEGLGEALDQDDKGHNKAITNAHKYVLMKVFDITSGDPTEDPDIGGHDDLPAPPPKRPMVRKEPETKGKAGTDRDVIGVQEAEKLLAKLVSCGKCLPDLHRAMAKSEPGWDEAVAGMRYSPENWPASLAPHVRAWSKQLKAVAEPPLDMNDPNSMKNWVLWKVTVSWDTEIRQIQAKRPHELANKPESCPKTPLAMVTTMVTGNDFARPDEASKWRAIVESLRDGVVIYPEGVVLPF